VTNHIRDARTAQVKVTMLGHEGRLHAAALSSDGSTVVTASANRSAVIWDAVNDRELAMLWGYQTR
jgi:WD40 repeat protein